jgi:translation initiation factor 1
VKKRRITGENDIVWSSDPVPTPAHRQSVEYPARARRAGDGVVTVSLESKGRRGKSVTVVAGAPVDAAGLDDLARDLKQRCGCGGTVRGEIVEVQGDQREVVRAELVRRGWIVSPSG